MHFRVKLLWNLREERFLSDHRVQNEYGSTRGKLLETASQRLFNVHIVQRGHKMNCIEALHVRKRLDELLQGDLAPIERHISWICGLRPRCGRCRKLCFNFLVRLYDNRMYGRLIHLMRLHLPTPKTRNKGFPSKWSVILFRYMGGDPFHRVSHCICVR